MSVGLQELNDEDKEGEADSPTTSGSGNTSPTSLNSSAKPSEDEKAAESTANTRSQPAQSVKCSVCGNASRYMCGRCQEERYCSSNCQHAHWSHHRKWCKKGSSTSVELSVKKGCRCVKTLLH